MLHCSDSRVDIHEEKMHKNDVMMSFCVTDKMKIHQELIAGGKPREKPGMESVLKGVKTKSGVFSSPIAALWKHYVLTDNSHSASGWREKTSLDFSTVKHLVKQWLQNKHP